MQRHHGALGEADQRERRSWQADAAKFSALQDSGASPSMTRGFLEAEVPEQ
jgi:hypothetical protein